MRRRPGLHSAIPGAVKRARAAWLRNLDDRTCALKVPGLCKGWADTVDDITPLARGGDAANPANWQPACRSCNSSRGSRMRHAGLARNAAPKGESRW